MCGAISQYNSTEPTPAPRNLALIIGKRLTMRGFLVGDHGDRMKDMLAEVGGWLRRGQAPLRGDHRRGAGERAAAFLDMMRGHNTGKMLVELAG